MTDYFQIRKQKVQTEDDGTTRVFETGATRDTAEGKFDYEAFLSPVVLERYAEYMHSNRMQSDGTLRDGDNWQKGIPRKVYIKSLWRHLMTAWEWHRFPGPKVEMEKALCGIIFNAMGYLHEILKPQDGVPEKPEVFWNKQSFEWQLYSADGTLKRWLSPEHLWRPVGEDGETIFPVDPTEL